MKRIINRLLITLLIPVGLVLSLTVGCLPDNDITSEKDEGLSRIEEAWEIIFQDYVDRGKLDADVLSEAAIKGMLEALDDTYTAYLNADDYQEWSIKLEGSYEGIGAYLGVMEERLVVIAPIPGSPAEAAGIKPGDVILEIDGQPAQEMSPEEAAAAIRGQKVTAVRLLIVHQGETEPEVIEIIRAKIELPSVYFEMKEDIAYIYIGHFSDRTNEELTPVLESITEERATGIILDLRSNGGGYLDEAVDVAGRFLDEGVVVSVVDNKGNESSMEVDNDGQATDLSMIVLTDNYTASSSEILAGALQDHGRAEIAGQKTFGKGSYTLLYQLEDSSGLNITAGRWLTPDGNLIEGEGITPDYILELEGEEAIQWAIDYLRGNIE